MGDSRHPLYYLIFSACLNVVLDLLFIGVFHMGVGSAAAATAISQAVSALLCLVQLVRTKEVYKVSLKEIRFHKDMLGQILRYGLPSGVQNSVIAIANVVVQSNINSFGDDAMAGCGSYSRVEGFAFLPITCFSMSLTTFIGQNLGAQKFDRAKAGARFGILCSVVMAEIIGAAIWLLAPYCIALFNDSPEVVALGARQARTEALFYCLLAFSHCIAGIRLLPRRRVDLPRRGQGQRAHVYHARLLVSPSYRLYYRHRAFYPQHRRRLLGVSPHLGIELGGVSRLLPEIGLGTCL